MPVRPLQHPAGTLLIATPSNRAHLSRLSKAGRTQRLAPGIYVEGASLPLTSVVYQHRFAIIASVWPEAVLSDRTALSGSEPVDGWMFISHPEPRRAADLALPGLTISVKIGPGKLPGDMPLPCDLAISGSARALVENLDARGRPPSGRPSRVAGTAAVEDRIDEQARTGGAGRIQNMLVQLDAVAGFLPSAAVETVRARLAEVLGTVSGGRPPSSPRLAARLAGAPFDQHRLDMFQGFADYLDTVAPEPRSTLGPTTRWDWLTFFESYFSNFIEGTQFGVEEARLIAIEGRVPVERPQDAHDISATYRIASDPTMSSTVATSGQQFLDLLREQHTILMAPRQDKNPGVFKSLPNFAGGYQFVDPELVSGTLTRGFEIFDRIPDPFQKAIATMFLITECHPFDDGNGRIARLAANAYLTVAGQVRIVVPTVYRNDYLAGLTAMSNRAGHGEALHAVLTFAQRWTASIDWTTYEDADGQMQASNAYLDASTAERNGTRLRMPSRV